MIIGFFLYISMFNFVPTLNFPAHQIFLIYSIARFLFTFATTLLQWASKLRSLSIVTPRSFSVGTSSMRLCMVYKAYYNLAMFPLLQYAIPATIHTWGHNLKFILPHCSRDVFKNSFLSVLLRAWNAHHTHRRQWRL